MYVRTHCTVMAGTRLESDVTVLPYVPITSLVENLLRNSEKFPCSHFTHIINTMFNIDEDNCI